MSVSRLPGMRCGRTSDALVVRFGMELDPPVPYLCFHGDVVSAAGVQDALEHLGFLSHQWVAIDCVSPVAVPKVFEHVRHLSRDCWAGGAGCSVIRLWRVPCECPSKGLCDPALSRMCAVRIFLWHL